MAPRQLKFDSSRDLAVVVALLNVSKEEEEEDVHGVESGRSAFDAPMSEPDGLA